MVTRSTRRGARGQMIPIVALLALVLFAFAALALDGGLAFSARRGDQNIVDNAALAGAQDLLHETTSPSFVTDQQTARKDAMAYILKNVPGVTAPACATNPSTFVTDIDNKTNVCNVGSYDVQIYTPVPSSDVNPATPYSSRDLAHMVEVEVNHHSAGNFLAAAGMNRFFVTGAKAVAMQGVNLPAHSHAVWSTFSKSGGGNTLFVDGSGLFSGQVDDGNNGNDCNDASAADLFSNQKEHAPPGGGMLFNINGNANFSNFDHDQVLRKWWTIGVPDRGVSQDGDPAFNPPYHKDTGLYAINPAPVVDAVKKTVTYSPGYYTSSVTLPGALSGYDFIFPNGIYWFHNASITFGPGSYNAYSPDYKNNWTRNSGPDGVTDGVEFYIEGNNASSYFSAQGGHVNFQAPDKINGAFVQVSGTRRTTNHIGIFVDSNDQKGNVPGLNANGPPGNVNFPLAIGDNNGHPATGEYFHLRGTAYLEQTSTNDSSVGALAQPGSTDLNQYAIQGQLIASYVFLSVGTVSTTQYTGCHDDTTSNPGGAGKLVQYDPTLVPSAEEGAISSLVR